MASVKSPVIPAEIQVASRSIVRMLSEMARKRSNAGDGASSRGATPITPRNRSDGSVEAWPEQPLVVDSGNGEPGAAQ
mgnify:CR=1 FL=1